MLSQKRQNEIIRALYVRLDKHERWQALYDVKDSLDETNLMKAFIDVWVDSESNGQYLHIIDELVDEFNICSDRVMPLMGKKDQIIFGGLPDVISIYRGTTLERPYGDYSWTYEKDQALWFAKRTPQGTPALAVGSVDKRDILFLTNKRGESEVAVNPDCVEIISLDAVGEFQNDPMAMFYFQVQSSGLLHDLKIKGMAQSLLKSGLTPLEAECRVHALIDEIEGYGFVHAAADHRHHVDAIDWDELVEAEGVISTLKL
jgi:hypothetical protein